MSDSGSEARSLSDSSSASATAQRMVLIVDDESIIRWSLKKFFEEEGFNVVTASSGLRALKNLEETNFDLVFLDIQLPDANGIDLLKTVKGMDPSKKVIMITGHADIRGSVEAMKTGAFDYLEKPLDFDNLRTILQSIKTDLVSPQNVPAVGDFIFTSSRMKEVVRIAERLATKSDATILILGESGTGKNFLCKRMHELSPRRMMPFVEIGCSNIPEHLIESELFGYEKGAFTDAKGSKKGLVEMAQRGSIFLDEIGDMPYQMQSKILTLIEEKRFRKIGGLEFVQTDARIFAATNRNLYELVESKKFRLDLYYRLNVASIEMPPLRERKEDIPLLVEHFLGHYGEKYQSGPKSISPDALKRLQDYEWPGNVREIKNLIEKLVILSKDEVIDLRDISMNGSAQADGLLPDDLEAETGLGAGVTLKDMEEAFIKTALKLAGGNQRKAAKLLNISRDTLRYRLKKMKEPDE